MGEWLAMNGDGAFVWTCYAFSFVAIATLIILRLRDLNRNP